jgi:hypothetical protein
MVRARCCGRELGGERFCIAHVALLFVQHAHFDILTLWSLILGFMIFLYR